LRFTIAVGWFSSTGATRNKLGDFPDDLDQVADGDEVESELVPKTE
jgi:hypothetical protein